jgi:hypothetical protein
MAQPLRSYLRLLAGLTIISGLGQLVLPGVLGAASAWGVALGWQREIAFWNVAMYLVIARTLRANHVAGARTVAIALVVLQLLAATNHAAAAIQGHAPLNTIMSVVNYGCVVFGVLALRVQPVGPSDACVTCALYGSPLRRFEPLVPVRTDPVEVLAADGQPAPAIEVDAERRAGATLGAAGAEAGDDDGPAQSQTLTVPDTSPDGAVTRGIWCHSWN